jgi:hypothetical protein
VTLSLGLSALKTTFFTWFTHGFLFTTVPNFRYWKLCAQSTGSTYRHARASLFRALPAFVVPHSGLTGSPSITVGQVLPSLKT